ncbi:MAG TPA: rubrerythrin, partial [Actinobacteria bacterium]|nr:rubrerythrin [Actinomycetes bacterium]HEX21461.1 rubrerythrin [Actinomycetota bacterium]
AIEKEAESAAFYSQLSKLSEASGSQKTFIELAEMERHHKNLLENLDMSKIPAKVEHRTPDLKISDYQSEVKFDTNIKYQDVLKIAMKAEEKAHRMYKDMADQYPEGSDIFRLFDFLTEQEAKHKLRLETEYDNFIFEED